MEKIRDLLVEKHEIKRHKDTGDRNETTDMTDREREVLCHEIKDSITRRHKKMERGKRSRNIHKSQEEMMQKTQQEYGAEASGKR